MNYKESTSITKDRDLKIEKFAFDKDADFDNLLENEKFTTEQFTQLLHLNNVCLLRHDNELVGLIWTKINNDQRKILLAKLCEEKMATEIFCNMFNFYIENDIRKSDIYKIFAKNLIFYLDDLKTDSILKYTDYILKSINSIEDATIYASVIIQHFKFEKIEENFNTEKRKSKKLCYLYLMTYYPFKKQCSEKIMEILISEIKPNLQLSNTIMDILEHLFYSSRYNPYIQTIFKVPNFIVFLLNALENAEVVFRQKKLTFKIILMLTKRTQNLTKIIYIKTFIPTIITNFEINKTDARSIIAELYLRCKSDFFDDNFNFEKTIAEMN